MRTIRRGPTTPERMEKLTALWYNLRNDPEWTPEWSKFMGNRPPAMPDAFRHWGDGATRAYRAHLIDDISFARNWVRCTCGVDVYATDMLTLEDVWNIHRGRADLVAERVLEGEREDRATDEDVHNFLVAASNPAFSFDPQ